MTSLTIDPFAYFSAWFAQPLVAKDPSVRGVMDCLNRHPLSRDESTSNYVMPERRNYEQPGRFRVFGENQDLFYCFVSAGQENSVDPPVYFETCLDLQRDYGFQPRDIIDGDHVLVCDRFTDFLWHMLGEHVCLRTEHSAILATGVHGVVGEVEGPLGPEFKNPLGKPFPSGYTFYFSEDIICCPRWGVAYANNVARHRFLKQHDFTHSRWLAKPAWPWH